MLSIVFKGIAVITLLCCLFILGNQFDDELSSQAKLLLKPPVAPTESNGYLYHNGIFARAELDPASVGRDIYENTISDNFDPSYAEKQYPDSLPVPQGAMFCSLRDDDCASTLISQNYDITALKKENATLLKRNSEFHEFKNYTTLTEPNSKESLPQYHYFFKAERILVLDAIAQHKAGKSEEAIEMLHSQLSRLRLAFSRQDHLLGKMVFLASMNDIVDMASMVLSESGNTTRKFQRLSKIERNLGSVAAREFGYVYNNFNSLANSSEDFKISSYTKNKLTRSVYKPNMTINAAAPRYSRLNRLSNLEARELAIELSNNSFSEPQTSLLRNLLGYVILGESSDLDRYVARIMDFNTKIELFNHLYHDGFDFNTSENPYFETATAELRRGKVCFLGLTQIDNFECLNISENSEILAGNTDQE